MKSLLAYFSLFLVILLGIGSTSCGPDKIDEPVAPEKPTNPSNSETPDNNETVEIPDHGVITGIAGPSVKWKYTESTKTIEFTGKGKMTEKSDSYDYPWITLNIEKAIIGEGITNLPKAAFWTYYGIPLSSISLPQSLEIIGEEALAYSKITSIEIPSKVKEIGNRAFAYCENVTSIHIPRDAMLEIIGKNAFDGIDLKFNSFELSQNVRIVKFKAFGDIKFSTLKLNDKLEEVSQAAFRGIQGTLEIPNSVKKISTMAFGSDMTEIIIGTGLKNIESGAFFCPLVSNGKMYINQSNPPTITECDGRSEVIYIGAEKTWTLYVPSGCKQNYVNVSPWCNFKSIVEDSSLEGAITGYEGHPRGPVSESLSGTGTESNPYLIQSAADLRYLSDTFQGENDFKGKYFKQTANITINNIYFDGNCNLPSDFAPSTYEIWVPIGTKSYKFNGKYDGNGFSISGLYYDSEELSNPLAHIGLFGVIESAQIYNVNLSNIVFKGSRVGGLVGSATGSDISGCTIKKSTINGEYAGGIGGFCTYDNKFDKCKNSALITGSIVGGIAGLASKTWNCINEGTIQGRHAGGIVGASYNSTTSVGAYITNCINLGYVEGTARAGGINGGSHTDNFRENSYMINNLNIGYVTCSDEFYSAAIVSYAVNSSPDTWRYYLYYNYILDISCPIFYGYSNSVKTKENKRVTSTELKSQVVLDELNEHRYDDDCCAWITGADGYPTLQW